MALALLMTVESTAVHSQSLTPNHPVSPTFIHVRSEEPGVRDLIQEGYARSATFKALVDDTETLRCLVYVSTSVKLSQGMRGALLHKSDGVREMPLLHVLVKTNLSPDEAIATIAHELQHVGEAMRGVPGGDGAAMGALFAALDTTGARGARKYETDAAVDVTGKVHDELRAFRRDHPLSR